MSKELFKVLSISLLVLVAILIAAKLPTIQFPVSTAEGQSTATPTATATPVVGGACTITGNVVNADTTPLVNGTITFNSQRVQVVGSTVVNPTYVTTNTDSGGNIRAFQMPMGVVAQVTICPPATGQGQSANCAAPFSVIIPFTNTANFGDIAQGTNLTGASTLVLTTLDVTGTLTYPDGSTYTSAGHNQMAALGLGAPVANSSPSQGQLLYMEKDWNGTTFATAMNNDTTGTTTQAGYHANAGNVGTSLWMMQTGAGYVSSVNTALYPANSAYIYGDGGLDIGTGRNFPILFGVDNTLQGTWNLGGLTVDNHINATDYYVNGEPLLSRFVSWAPSVTGQCGGTCAADTDSGYAARVGNLVIANAQYHGTCTGMCGYLQVQGLPWGNSGAASTNQNQCIVEPRLMPLSPGYTMLDARILPGWAGFLFVESGSSQDGSYYFSDWPGTGAWGFSVTCSYLTDF